MLETWPTAALTERHRRLQLPSGSIDARRVRADEQLGAYRRAQQHGDRASDGLSPPDFRPGRDDSLGWPYLSNPGTLPTSGRPQPFTAGPT